mgnify:CR=1 FL=1
MRTAKFMIDGHEVTASFALQENREVVQRVKQILLSTFAAKKISAGENCTFAIAGEREDNMSGSDSDAP